jgi:hypothetical protein
MGLHCAVSIAEAAAPRHIQGTAHFVRPIRTYWRYLRPMVSDGNLWLNHSVRRVRTSAKSNAGRVPISQLSQNTESERDRFEDRRYAFRFA